MSFSIGALVGYLRLDDAQYATALKRNARQTEQFAMKATQVFGSIVGPAALTAGVAMLTRTSMQYSAQAVDTAEQTGLTVAQFIRLDQILKRNGASGDMLTSIMTKLRSSVADAANGSKGAQDNFRRIGLHFSELINLSPAELLLRVARATENAGQNTQAFAAAADLLGTKNLPKLNASLKQIADEGLAGLNKNQAFAQMVANADKLDERLEKIGATATAVTTVGLGKVEETLQRIEEWGESGDTFFNRWDRWWARMDDPEGFARREKAQAAAEIAEERRMQRRAVAQNEEKRRIDALVASWKSAPGSGRSGSIKQATLDKAAEQQRKRALTDQRDLLSDQLEIVRKQQQVFERGLAFSAANDPLIDYAERIRDANEALKSGVVTAVAYKNALRDAASSFGAAKLGELENIGSMAGLRGESRKSSTIDRALARARKSAAQGQFGDAQNQIDYINSLGAGEGMTLEQAIGQSAMPGASKIAGDNANKANSLEDRVDKLTTALEDIAKRLTVS
jgi:hypothetical protein